MWQLGSPTRRVGIAAAITSVVAVAVSAGPAAAIPVFAHRYGLTCQACHTVVPHLTSFGKAFLANGYRIRGLKPRSDFPVAIRVESAYASAGTADPDSTGGPLPKTIVDEVELLTGGSMGSRGSYWAEAYVVDGGRPGRPRDVWAAYRATPDAAKMPVTFRAGEFTLPLPLDPETFRETTQPYAIWSQNAGNNPFNFFDVKQGGTMQAGDPGRQLTFSASAMRGYDIGSGLQPHGVDTMLTAQRDLGDFSLWAYRYDGSRLLSGLAYGNTIQIDDVADRFWRNGFAALWNHSNTEVDAVYQIGNDSAADLYGDSLTTSGGFLQVRQAIGTRAFAIARWDATRDAGFARTITVGGGLRLSRNTRLTLFETGARDVNGTLLHILSSSLLFAY